MNCDFKKQGQKWRCINPGCAREIKWRKGDPPRATCGGKAMRDDYTAEDFLAIQYFYLPQICGAEKPAHERCEHLDMLVACNDCGCAAAQLIGRPDKAKEMGVGVRMDCPRWHRHQ